MSERVKKQTVRKETACPVVTTLDITVLSGGPSEEREVSLASGQAVATALLRCGYQVALRDVSPEDLSALDRPADFVFIALHGPFGEDGTLQQILEDRHIRYCGSGPVASALAMNKAAAKVRFLERGMPTPPFEVATVDRSAQAATRWRTPVIVKPVGSGSSVDTFLVHRHSDVARTIEYVARRHGEALVEEYVKGPELTVGVVGDTALPVCQIRTRREFYDYQAKYIDDDTEYLFDIALPAPLLARVQSLSLQAATALDCRDFCRVDWMVDECTHEPYVLEVNTIPGFTSHSLLPKAAAQAGISFDDLCRRIVTLGMQR